MKNIWVIANWKANKTISEALEWVSMVGPQIPKNENLKVVICPTFISLEQVAKEIKVGGFNLMVSSQDLSAFEIGAYTGEVPARLLSGMISLSIIGHSERRANFNETNETIVKKVDQAQKAGIIPLVCVQGKETPIPDGSKLIAYEPVWAISTGLTNTPGIGKADNPEEADQVAEKIKEEYGKDIEVLYGGSVNWQNVKSFIGKEHINGVLVGNASLDAQEFVRIIGECVHESS